MTHSAIEEGETTPSKRTSLVHAAQMFLIVAGLSFHPSEAVAASRSVQVVVTHVRDNRGMVHVELCTEQSFLKRCALVVNAPAKAGTTVVTFSDVTPGLYAAQAYHDRNHNGKADRNFVGLPTEDVGFSNDALTHLAPPKFAAAAFVHGDGPQRITFTMRSVP